MSVEERLADLKAEVTDRLHEHDLRINSIEIKQDAITVNVTDLKADRKRLLWIIVTIIVSGLVYSGLSGLEGLVHVG